MLLLSSELRHTELMARNKTKMAAVPGQSIRALTLASL